MSTDALPADRLDSLKDGVFCYLHLWAALRKHVELHDDEIISGIGLWDDHEGSYFAAYNHGNKNTLQLGMGYVCAVGEEGPTVGQFERIPPCTPVSISSDVLMLLNALAQCGGQNTDSAIKQIELLATMIDKGLPQKKRKAKLH